jgi:Arc/MetJ-type ribon-helix-helix transcriptional regulator
MSMLLHPDIERRIADKVSNGLYESPSQVVQEGLDLLDRRDEVVSKASAASPVWDALASISEDASSEQWSQVPADFAKNLDYYLYGSSKLAE